MDILFTIPAIELYYKSWIKWYAGQVISSKRARSFRLLYRSNPVGPVKSTTPPRQIEDDSKTDLPSEVPSAFISYSVDAWTLYSLALREAIILLYRDPMTEYAEVWVLNYSC